MSNFLHYTLAFLFVLGVLIIVHEFGHYLVARWVGVKVLKFSIGFGQVVYSKRMGRDQTEWALAIVPLGGFVKMLDEREGDVAPQDLPRSFNQQSVWRRMAIVAAGPLANFLLAVLVYWGGFLYGVEELRPLLGKPVISSPAAQAGVEDGERVLRIQGDTVETWQEVRWKLLTAAANRDTVELEVINPRKEIAFRYLNVSDIRESGWKGDALERLGLQLHQIKIPAIIGRLNPDSVAAMAGLRIDDVIVGIDGQRIESWQEVVRTVRGNPGRQLAFDVMRKAEMVSLLITPGVVVDNGNEIGRIGAGVRDFQSLRNEMLITVRYGIVESFGKALSEAWDKTVFSVSMMGKMLTGEVSWQNISGPITIADYAGQSAKSGASQYFKFLALVSISLAVLNLMPIPILDGGHLLYYVVEAIRRKPLSERCMELGQKIGMFLLFMLMACSFYNDINRLISG